MATMNLTLFADSDCDITPEIAEKYGYRLISMPYTMDGKEIFPYETEKTFDPHAFYERLRHGTIPKTAGLSPEKYISYFEPELQKGNDILYIHFSSKLSGTFNAMHLAIEMLKEKYPERTIHTFDTKAITSLALVILIEVGKLYQQGKSLDELLTALDDLVHHYAFFAFADDLKFFKASGRVSGISAFLGGALGIKPIISIDKDGYMKPVGKVAGKKKAFMTIIEDIEKKGDDIANHPFLIIHSDISKELLEYLRGLIVKHFGDIKAEEIIVSPVGGSHAGPDCLGIAFHAKHR